MFVFAKYEFPEAICQFVLFLGTVASGSDGVCCTTFWITTVSIFFKGTNFDMVLKNSYFLSTSRVVRMCHVPIGATVVYAVSF